MNRRTSTVMYFEGRPLTSCPHLHKVSNICSGWNDVYCPPVRACPLVDRFSAADTETNVLVYHTRNLEPLRLKEFYGWRCYALFERFGPWEQTSSLSSVPSRSSLSPEAHIRTSHADLERRPVEKQKHEILININEVSILTRTKACDASNVFH